MPDESSSTADEDQQIEDLARASPGETSWEAITRKRRLVAKLEAAIKRDTPKAVGDAKLADLKVADLAEMWEVTAAWIYTVAPARPRKQERGTE